MAWLFSNPWLLSFAIMLARIVDVSLDTVRTIMVFRGYRLLSSVIGFVQVLIWLAAAGQVLKNLNHWYLAVAYALGFALGNGVGIWLESKMALGQVVVQVVSENEEISMAHKLRQHNYHATSLIGKNSSDRPVEIVILAEQREHLPQLQATILLCDPDAFYMVSDARGVYQSSVQTQRIRPGWKTLLR